MTPLHSILRRVGRGMSLNLALAGSGLGVVGGSLPAILMVLVDRGFEAAEIPVAAFVGICLTGALAGLVRGLVTSPCAAEVAAALDARLVLKNRLGTAAAIEARAVPDSDFALLVLRDAEQA